MIHRVLLVGRWVVDFLFAVHGYDEEGVLACLRDYGAPERVLLDAIDLMGSCDCDCGFTYANMKKRLAVVLIGPTSGGDEFIDTFVHEVRHIVDAIAEDAGVTRHRERPAYLAGDMARALAETVCELGCIRCRG